ncbi:hypothetical protein ACP4OV_022046 [Aristida adscensionis]
MGMSSVSLLLLLCASMAISAVADAEADDAAALLAIKAAAVVAGGMLASWNSSGASVFCSWEGVTCRSGMPRRVVALSLPSGRLNGVLSPAIGNLSSLELLNVSSNFLGGGIPASLGRLRRLRSLDLSRNSFSGELPANLSSCTGLAIVILNSNRLGGRIPSELGDMARLKMLNLMDNGLTGAVPPSLANLSSLTHISLTINQLEGAIPPSLGAIVGLRRLDLAYNLFSGELPRSLYNSSSLEGLDLQGNLFRGSIPANIGSSLPSIFFLSFGANQFTGSIPASITNLTTLKVLDVSQNRLSGHVPATIGSLRALKHLYIHDNMLEADDRSGWEFITSLSNCRQLQHIELGSNPAFTGQLPTSIVNLSTTLQILRFDDTRISGSIPSGIDNLAGLEFLGAANTSISGVIPESIGKLANLVQLGLYNTQLSGLVPSSIGNLSKLTILYAYSAKLEGSIPASLGKLKNLRALSLSKNRLNGSIPREIFKLPLLSNILDLSYNTLSGPLPYEIGSLRNLNNLVLSGNQLSGEIPESIGECTVLEKLWLDNNSFEGRIPHSLNNIKGLIAFNLSKNKLSGAIPDSISRIYKLQQLYLAHNNLSGPIPTALLNLTSLSELDLSYNNLQGEVSKEGIFRNLTEFSITGNNELCGGIPELQLAPCHTNSREKNRKWKLKVLKIVLATVGGLLFLAFVIALVQFIHKKLRQKQKIPFLPSIIEEQYERVSYQSLANGTSGFSEANLLGKGSFGAVYKCTFQDEGFTAAVKVFNLEQAGSTRSFVAECGALRRVRHRCLIKIITCCVSINHQGEEFKALVFELMPNGSLHDWLHPKSGMATMSNTLSLEQRLNIAVDIMDAMDYLHNHCQPPVIHCDVKPSNILLADDMSARVGDFGISKILQDSASITLQNSNSTIGLRGSIGYVAPEYGEGSSISTLGDVYSLGILVLEMFIGRSPTDDMFQGPSDLHKYSEGVLPERIWEVADATMWLHTDANDRTTRSIIQNCLVSVISLGISCSKKQPRERVTIQDAAIEMHAIRDSYLKFVRSLVVENGAATTLQ